MPTTCPKCSAPATAGSATCEKCGALLMDVAIAAPPVPVLGPIGVPFGGTLPSSTPLASVASEDRMGSKAYEDALRFGRSAKHTMVRAIGGSAKVHVPAGLTLDGDRLYLLDLTEYGGARILRFLASNGELEAVFGPYPQGGGPGAVQSPTALCVGLHGTIWVVDSGNHRLQEFGPDGKLLRTVGSEGSAPGQFRAPSAIHVDPKGRLLVADTRNDRVQLLGPAGEPLLQLGAASSEDEGWDEEDGGPTLSRPHGVSVGRDGEFLVADTHNHRIVVFGPDGAFLRAFGEHGARAGSFYFPTDVEGAEVGHLYAADLSSSRIQKFTGEGEFDFCVRLDFLERIVPRVDTFAVGGDGLLYVADENSRSVLVLRVHEDEQ